MFAVCCRWSLLSGVGWIYVYSGPQSKHSPAVNLPWAGAHQATLSPEVYATSSSSLFLLGMASTSNKISYSVFQL